MIRMLAIMLLMCGLNVPMVSAQTAEMEWRKDEGEIQDTQYTPVKENEATKSALTKWSFGINGGYAHRLFRTGFINVADREKYIKDMKSGIAFGGNVSYYPWQKVGFGVKYEMYRSKAQFHDELTEDVTIQHLSGLITHRSILKNHKTAILTSLLLGYQPYQNKTALNTTDFTIEGETMGWGVSVGVERRLGERFYLNLTGTAMMGALYRVERKTSTSTATLHLSKDHQVDLSRVSVTLGLGFLK